MIAEPINPVAPVTNIRVVVALDEFALLLMIKMSRETSTRLRSASAWACDQLLTLNVTNVLQEKQAVLAAASAI
jgi:hypothetical protein